MASLIPMCHGTKHQGYVLVFTLGVVALAGLAMVGLSRLALDNVVQASAAARTLQRRWGVISVTRAVLPQSDLILARQEAADRRYAGACTFGLRLADQNYEVTIADEQAKVNANLLLDRGDKQDAERAIADLCAGTSLRSRVRLHLGKRSGNQAQLNALGEMFDGATAEDLFGSFDPEQSAEMGTRDTDPVGPISTNAGDPSATGAPLGPSGRLTCWGDGRLNFRRASQASLSAVCTPLLSQTQVSQLQGIRDQSPNLSLVQALSQLGLSMDAQNKLTQMLGESSLCYSIHVVCFDGRRAWNTLAVLDKTRTTQRQLNFEW